MKKKIVLSLAVALPIFIMAFAERSSSGAPASHTGAPGEKTCATSGCHDDNQPNSGSAKLTIDIASGTTKYVTGETYPIKIHISDPHVNRFGFQIVALADDSKENAGKFIITDPERTQFMKNEFDLLDRKYVTYTFNGTDAVSAGEGEWIINWTAPATATGKITFYVGAVSANDDETDKGDIVYTASNTLSNQ